MRAIVAHAVEVADIWSVFEPLSVTDLRPAAARCDVGYIPNAREILQESSRATFEDRFLPPQTPRMLWAIQTYVDVNSDARHR